jgi:hypothetical protein
MRRASEIAQRFLALADAQTDPAVHLDARVAVALPAFYAGDVASSDVVESALARHPRDLRCSKRSAYHPGVYLLGQCHSGMMHWMRGYPDRALQRLDEALSLAREMGDPFVLACVLDHVGLVLKFRGDDLLEERAAEFASLTAEHGFWFFGHVATELQGVAAARRGDHDRGIEYIRRGREGLHVGGADIGASCWYGDLATACLAAGRVAEAFRYLDAGFAITSAGDERYWEPELYRLYGEALLLVPSGAETAGFLPGQEHATPEWAFGVALARARANGAKSLELRAATSLARLWRSTGEAERAVQLLGPIYAWFTEGHATLDLRCARAVLAERGGPL